MRIVVVEDEALSRKTLISLITMAGDGYRVVGESENAKDALEIVERTHPDVLITDIRMPNQSGLDLIQALKEKNYRMYVIIISGYSEFKYAQDAIRLGVKQYILKPFSLEDIASALDAARQVLDNDYRSALADTQAQPAATQNTLVNQAISLVNQNLKRPCSLNEIAQNLYVSPEHLSRLFKTNVGMTFSAFVTKSKIECACGMMSNTDLSIADIAESVGYSGVKQFARTFKENMGVGASEYIRQTRLHRK